MSRVFAYSRVSTADQNNQTQFDTITAAGHEVKESRRVAEVVSGGVQAFQRPEFAKLVDKLEEGDTLIVSKLDRLGRDNIDVQSTILTLAGRGIKVMSLDLPTSDLSSAEGKLMLQLFSAFAEFEKSRIAERTQEGLARARAEGKKLGRPEATKTTKVVQEHKISGYSQSQTAEASGLSLATIKRHWNKKGVATVVVN